MVGTVRTVDGVLVAKFEVSRHGFDLLLCAEHMPIAWRQLLIVLQFGHDLGLVVQDRVQQ
jgi:hypothetical protein